MTETQLLLHSVAERGIPHRERVVLRVLEDTNTALFALTIGLSTDDGRDARPIPDNFLWLAGHQVKKDDWILVYTGPGMFRTDQFQGNEVFSIYWGRKQTVFYNNEIVPVLMRFDGLAVVPPPHPSRPLPQVSAIEDANVKL